MHWRKRSSLATRRSRNPTIAWPSWKNRIKDLQSLLEMKNKAWRICKNRLPTPATGNTSSARPEPAPPQAAVLAGYASSPGARPATPAAPAVPPAPAPQTETAPAPSQPAQRSRRRQSDTHAGSPRPACWIRCWSSLPISVRPLSRSSSSAPLWGVPVKRRRECEVRRRRSALRGFFPKHRRCATAVTASGNAAVAGFNRHFREVDPVAEAEIFLAYGRDAQAEELLKEALATSPKALTNPSQAVADLRESQGCEVVREGCARPAAGTGGAGAIWTRRSPLATRSIPEYPLCGRQIAAGTALVASAAAATAAAENVDFNIGWFRGLASHNHGHRPG